MLWENTQRDVSVFSPFRVDEEFLENFENNSVERELQIQIFQINADVALCN